MQFSLRFGLLFALGALLPGWAAAQSVDRHTSTVTVDRTTALANGADLVTVTVRVLKGDQQPYPGKEVILALSGPGDTVVQPAFTDANGVCSGAVATTRAGLRTVRARVLNGDHQVLLDQRPVIDFGADLRVRRVSPRFVPVEGAHTLTLRGEGFASPGAGTTTVQVGTRAASAVVVVNDTTITCVAPEPDPAAEPAVDVTVANVYGQATLEGDLTYADQIRRESFDGPGLPSWLEAAEGGPMVIEGGVIHDPGDDSSVDRRYVRTTRKDYIVQDFVFEATLNVGPTPTDSAPILYAGIGRGEPDLEFHREPRWGTGFRLTPFALGGDVQVAGTMERGNFRFLTLLGWQYGEGTRRVRIEKRGGVITFSFMTSWTGGAFVPDLRYVFDDIAGGAPSQGTDSSALYFGGGGTQSSFDDVVVALLPPPAGLASLEPTFGLEAGGEAVTLKGRGFLTGGAPTITFGDQPATSIVVVDDRTVTCAAPAADLLEAPFVDVTLADAHGTTTLPRSYCYATQLRRTDFNAGTLPPWLEDPTGVFVLEDGELRDPSPDPEPTLRSYIRTTASNYDRKDFVYELTVRAGGADFSTLGIGTAEPDPNGGGQPIRSLYLRVFSFELGSGHLHLTLHGDTEAPWHDIGESWVRGHRRVRFIKQGHRIGVHHMERWPGTGPFRPEVSFAIKDIRTETPYLQDGRLFFGGSAPSFRYDELRIATLRESPVRLVSIDSPDGASSGGVGVTIHGEGFSTLGPSPVVKFGAGLATGVTVVDDATLTCVTPPGPLGRVAVQVRGAAGSGLLLEGYRYGF